MSVFGPSSFPLGTETLIITPFFLSNSSPTSLTFSTIIFFGVGFIAALPISNPNPGFVTLPTPSPPSISISPILFVNSTSTKISVPCVTSGSSPPSFMTEHFAESDKNSHELILISNLEPFGKMMSTF